MPRASAITPGSAHRAWPHSATSYEIAGTKPDRTEQIGNAVPVNLVKSLVESLLTDEFQTLTDSLEDDPTAVGVPFGFSQGIFTDD